jgi:hypothetical protein
MNSNWPVISADLSREGTGFPNTVHCSGERRFAIGFSVRLKCLPPTSSSYLTRDPVVAVITPSAAVRRSTGSPHFCDAKLKSASRAVAAAKARF